MYVVIAYDIPSNRRRTKLFKALSGQLTSVQRSVFEGDVPESVYGHLHARILALLDRREDSVRIYRQCGRCLPAIEVLGVGTIVDEAPNDIIM